MELAIVILSVCLLIAILVAWLNNNDANRFRKMVGDAQEKLFESEAKLDNSRMEKVTLKSEIKLLINMKQEKEKADNELLKQRGYTVLSELSEPYEYTIYMCDKCGAPVVNINSHDAWHILKKEDETEDPPKEYAESIAKDVMKSLHNVMFEHGIANWDGSVAQSNLEDWLKRSIK